MNARLVALVTCTAVMTTACTKQIVVSENDRLVSVVSASAPRTIGRSKRRHGLRLVVRDPRSGIEDQVSLPRGSCPAWRSRADVGMTVLVHYVTTRPEDSKILTSHATSQGLSDRIC